MPLGGIGGAAGGAIGGGGAAIASSRSAYVNIAVMAGVQALAALSQPGPKRPGKDNIKLNYGDAAQVWSYVAGTVKTYPHLIWFGDYLAKKVKNDHAIENILLQSGLGGLAGFVSGGGTFVAPPPPSAYIAMAEGAALGGITAGIGQLRTASYKHLAGFCYGICHGPIDGIKTIWVDEKLAYTGSTSNAGNTITIDQPKMWGGDHEQGGLYAVCDIVQGNYWPTQLVNPYLASQATSAPAYSGKSLFIWHGPSGSDRNSGYFAATPSDSPIVRPIAFEVCRFPNNLGVPTYKACGSDSLDANPAEVAYEWITNRVYGGRLPASRVDLASFQSGAQTHFTEGLGCSFELNSEYDVESALDDISSMADVVIAGSLHSGTLKYTPIRRTYSIPALPVYRHGNDSSVTDKSQFNVIDIEAHELGTWKGTANDIKLEYVNRKNNYQKEKQPAFDTANREIQGKQVTVQKSFRGVSLPDTAALVATREMRAASFPRPSLTLHVNRQGYNYHPGDVIKLISYKYQWTKILRILEVGIGKEDDSRIRLSCVEDVFGVSAAAYADSGTGGFTYPLSPTSITTYEIQESPYFLSKSDDPEVLVFAEKPNNSQIKYDVKVSTDLGTSYSEEASDTDFAIKGVITEAVDRLTDVKVTSLTFTPDSLFDADLLEDATTDQIAGGANLIHWPDTGEWGAVETVSDNGDGTYTLGNVWRAVGGFDSVPAAHDAGAAIWFFSGRRALSSTHAVSSDLRLKLISNALGGDYAEASAVAISHTTTDRAVKPLPVRGVTVNASYLTEVIPTGDLVLAWKETNRTTEGAVVLQTDPTATAEAATQYEIKIYGNLGVLLRTVTGLTSPTYTYTNATEVSDAGSLQNQLLFLITTIRDTTVRSFQTYVRRVLRTSSEAGLGCTVTVDGVPVTVDGNLLLSECPVTVDGIIVTVDGDTVYA